MPRPQCVRKGREGANKETAPTKGVHKLRLAMRLSAVVHAQCEPEMVPVKEAAGGLWRACCLRLLHARPPSTINGCCIRCDGGGEGGEFKGGGTDNKHRAGSATIRTVTNSLVIRPLRTTARWSHRRQRADIVVEHSHTAGPHDNTGQRLSQGQLMLVQSTTIQARLPVGFCGLGCFSTGLVACRRELSRTFAHNRQVPAAKG